jgi:cysteine desulfurase
VIDHQTGHQIDHMIYADNAATTQMSENAKKVMIDLMDQTWGNPSSLYSTGQKAKEVLEEARSRVAQVIGANPREIVFTSGGSEADNQALLTAAEIGKKSGKRHIIATAFEHHAILHTLKKLERDGFEVTLLDVHENGIVRPEEVVAALRGDTCLVTVMFANNEIGTIQPIREIGKICRERKVLFHTDAVQAIGHIPVDVARDNIDMLSASAHKFHGPKGVGFLYVKQGVRPVSLIEGGAQERGRRAGTENVAGIAAMATALEEAAANMATNAAHMTFMRDRIIAGLKKIPHSALNGDEKRRLPGNINFCFEGIEGESLLLLLDDKGIEASSGSACTSGSLDPSHVLLAIGRVHDVAHGSLRLSIGETITEEEADYIVRAVKDVVAQLRSFSPVWRDLCEGKRPYIL